MPTEEVQSQEDQINSAVVGRGVRLDMGEPVEALQPTPVAEPARVQEPEPEPVYASQAKTSPEPQITSRSKPVIEEMGLMGEAVDSSSKQGRRWAKPAAEDIDLMGDASKTSGHKGKKKPLTKGQKIGAGVALLALCLVAASNFLPKDGAVPAQQAQTEAGPDGAAPMPKEATQGVMVEVSAEDAELLKAAKLQKARDAAGAVQRIDGGGPLPSELGNVPARMQEPMTPLGAGVVAPTPAPAATYVAEVKPGAKMPGTAQVTNIQPEAPSKPADRNSASMDIPLTQNQNIPSDIAELREISDRANMAPPLAKLAAPLEESKAAPKPEVKPDPKPVAPEVLKKQPAATAPVAKVEPAAQKKTDPEPLKKVEVKAPEKVEKPKPVKPVRVAEEPRRAKPVRVESDEDLASGFALPIREVHANGRPVSQARPSAQEPAKVTFAEPKQSAKMSRTTPEVMHVDVGYGLVTNPSTQLPIRVKVGDSLPNGAVVSGFDPVKGLINTNRGSYGMK